MTRFPLHCASLLLLGLILPAQVPSGEMEPSREAEAGEKAGGFQEVEAEPRWIRKMETRPGYLRLAWVSQEYGLLKFKPEEHQHLNLEVYLMDIDLPPAQATELQALGKALRREIYYHDPGGVGSYTRHVCTLWEVPLGEIFSRVEPEYHVQLRRILNIGNQPLHEAAASGLYDSDVSMARLKRHVNRANSNPSTNDFDCSPCASTDKPPYIKVIPRAGFHRFATRTTGKTLEDCIQSCRKEPWSLAHHHLVNPDHNKVDKWQVRKRFGPHVLQRLVENVATHMQPLEGKYRSPEYHGGKPNKSRTELWVLWEMPVEALFLNISKRHHQELRQVLELPPEEPSAPEPPTGEPK